MLIEDVERYTNNILPKIEAELLDKTKTDVETLTLYNLYVDILKLVAKYDFKSFNKYLELDENHNDPTKAFYHHRKTHLDEVFTSFNDMEIYDKYDVLLISMPPRVGKTTSGIRFLSWIIGKYPENTQLATSYSDAITRSFYAGVIEIVMSDRYKDVFPDAPVVNQNAKNEEIWLKVVKRYPSIAFIPIEASMTGRGEANNYLYCDDLVSGIEQALSPIRLEKLWNLYTTNAKQRKKNNAKEIHIATRWSVHDPITKLSNMYANNSRVKIISLPCYDENKNSNFNFDGGFDTKYYNEIQSTMEELNFNALYMCEPIEREGLLYNKDELQYYFSLPDEKPDTIISVCDSKNMGKDFVCSPVGYVYDDLIYIEDVVFNNGLPEITRPLVANTWVKHNVIRGDVEMNNGGNYYAEDLNNLIKAKNGKTSIRTFFTGNNKNTKIITFADYVKKHFVFKDASTYSKNSEYAHYIESLLSWTQKGNNKHDDAPDATAMLAQLCQELSGCYIKIINRRTLGL